MFRNMYLHVSSKQKLATFDIGFVSSCPFSSFNTTWVCYLMMTCCFSLSDNYVFFLYVIRVLLIRNTFIGLSQTWHTYINICKDPFLLCRYHYLSSRDWNHTPPCLTPFHVLFWILPVFFWKHPLSNM